MRNCVTSIKFKKKYYTDLKLSDINDNMKFWKNLKPIFGNKNEENKTITLVDGNKCSLMMKNLLKLLINIL